MKQRTLFSMIVAVAVCIMLGTPAFGGDCPEELAAIGFGVCGDAPTLDAITMPATAQSYPGLVPPCEMIADMTLIWFKTTPEAIASLLPPDVSYIAPIVSLRNIWGIPDAYFPGFCAMAPDPVNPEDGGLGGTFNEATGECDVKPFGDEAVMTLALLDYVETSCYGPYQEVILLVPTITTDPDFGVPAFPPLDPNDWQYHYDLGPYHVGLYVPYLWLSSDGPIAAGRETWGYPKKMADIQFKDKNGKRIWKVDRSISADGTIGGDHLPILQKSTLRESIIKAWVTPDTTNPRHPDEVKFPPLYVNKIIPNVQGTAADINQLTLVPLDPQTSGEPTNPYVFFGEAGMELIGGPDDPINQIDVVQVYGGYQFRYNFFLSSGRTLSDYLAQ